MLKFFRRKKIDCTNQAKAWIIDRLPDLAILFPEANIKYKQLHYTDEVATCHMISVSPEWITHQKEFIDQEIKFNDDFEKKFSARNEILWITDSSLNQIDKPEFKITAIKAE